MGATGKPRKDVTYNSSADWMLRYHNKVFHNTNPFAGPGEDGSSFY